MATERQIAFIAKLIQERDEFLSIKENPESVKINVDFFRTDFARQARADLGDAATDTQIDAWIEEKITTTNATWRTRLNEITALDLTTLTTPEASALIDDLKAPLSYTPRGGWRNR